MRVVSGDGDLPDGFPIIVSNHIAEYIPRMRCAICPEAAICISLEEGDDELLTIVLGTARANFKGNERSPSRIGTPHDRVCHLLSCYEIEIACRSRTIADVKDWKQIICSRSAHSLLHSIESSRLF